MAALIWTAADAGPSAAQTAAKPLTIDDFAAEPSVSLVRLSPSGRHVAIVRRAEDVDLVYDLDLRSDAPPRRVFATQHETGYARRGDIEERVRNLTWKTDDLLVVDYVRAITLINAGTYPIAVQAAVATSGKTPPVLLNQRKAAGAEVYDLSWIVSDLPNDPDHILLGSYAGLGITKVDKVDLQTGTRQLVESATDVRSYEADPHGNLVARSLEYTTGTRTIEGRAPGQTKWARLFEYDRDKRELSRLSFLDAANDDKLYIGLKPETDADGPTRSVRTLDLKTGKISPVVWANDVYDFDSILRDPRTGEFLGACYWSDAYRCEFKSPTLNAQYKGIVKYFHDDHSVSVIDISSDDSVWLLSVRSTDDPEEYYVYDAKRRHVDGLGPRWPALTPDRLAPTRRFDFQSRDGMKLSGYVTEPRQAAGTWRLPLVVLPHGGPETRDTLSYDRWAQFIASRGYVVLQPNFRGSGGFGRKFAEAGYGQWGGRMHDDVMDATRALIAQGGIDPKRVCIVGGSFGGYEALYAAAKEPDTFRCAIALAAPSDLSGETKYELEFGVKSPRYQYWLKSVGDPAKDEARMIAHSPYRMAAGWRTPLLLIHGTKDETVPVEESRQMARALHDAGKPVRYVEIAGMGHGDVKPAETRRVLEEFDAFLATYLRPTAATPAPSSGRS